jgi:hypothetical protein
MVTTIAFTNTGDKSRAVVEIYGMDGKKLTELFNSEAETDQMYTVDWNAGALPNGLYMYRIICGEEVITGRLMLEK